MSELREFLLPIKGLAKRRYEWGFRLQRDFFANFDYSPISVSDVLAEVTMERRPDLLIFDIEMSGTVRCNCDRCTAGIDLPISGMYKLMVKLAFEENHPEDDEDIVFIHPEESHFDLSDYLYEFACLSVPISKTYDCEAEEIRPCNTEVLNRLDHRESSVDPNSDKEDIWEKIKRELN